MHNSAMAAACGPVLLLLTEVRALNVHAPSYTCSLAKKRNCWAGRVATTPMAPLMDAHSSVRIGGLSGSCTCSMCRQMRLSLRRLTCHRGQFSTLVTLRRLMASQT